MRKLGLTAAFVLMSTTAYAGEVHQFNIGGGTVRIEMRDCKRGSCPWVTWNEKSTSKTNKKLKAAEAETAEAASPAPAAPVVAAAAPVIAAPAASQAVAPPPPAAAPAPAPRPEDIAARAPVPAGPIAPAAASMAEPVRVADQPAKVEPRAQVATLAPAPEVKSEPALAPVKTAKPVGPLGEWITEDGEGRVLVEQCGANLCGKVSHAKNPNDTDKNNPDRSLRSRPVIGLPVLIDMKPQGERWEGKVYNAKDGKTYTAKLSMRNPNTLRVEGCIMGGMLCGGQNWKRAQ